MSRSKAVREQRWFAIGVYNGKNLDNLGLLWRTANTLGASYIFTIKNRYKKQPSDTTNCITQIPYFHFDTYEDF